MLTFRSAIVLALLCAPLAAAAVDRGVRVIDGDTFDIGGERIRLFGIDAPEMDQSCAASGKNWACGTWAKGQLSAFLSGGAVTCQRVDTDRYGRTVATCSVGGMDIGAQMVSAGAAVAYRRYSDRYSKAETIARAAAVGIWRGEMVSPEDHRHPVEPARACAIKGNISKSGRIYHMPGQRDYEATRINPSRGEAWFCSEADARAAGFRAARR